MIPYTLMSANLTGETSISVVILDASIFGFTYRLAKPFTYNKIIVHIYDYEAKQYHEVVLEDFTVTKESSMEYYDIYRVECVSSNYQQYIKSLMQQYDQYIKFKTEGINEMSKYPVHLDSDFDEIYTDYCVSEEYRQFLETKEIALCIDNSNSYQLYLEHSFKEFIQLYFKQKKIDHPLSQINYQYLYIGNQFCHFLLPEVSILKQLIAKTKQDNLIPVLCLPPMKEGSIAKFQSLLEVMENYEIVVNDWGTVQLIQEMHRLNPLTLGILLTKRRKDPRLQYKNDLDIHDIDHTGNHTSFYTKYLEKENILRYSYESAGYVMKLDHSDFYIPYYVTNVSSACTLKAVYKGNRSILFYEDTCDKVCLKHTIRYPSHLHLTGKYNALFVNDVRVLSDLNYLRNSFGRDCRIVVNL